MAAPAVVPHHVRAPLPTLPYRDSPFTLTVMADSCARTVDDDITDALIKLDHAERMLRDWRAHLVAQWDEPSEHRRWLIRCVKDKTVDTIIDAGAHTQQACDRLTAPHHSESSPRTACSA